MKRLLPSPLFLLPVIFLLVTAYAVMTAKYVTTPGIVQQADFRIFYTAGRLADSGEYSQLYNIQAQLKVQEALLGRSLQDDELLPFNHPPFLVPILQLICSQNYLASYWRWMLLMACLLVATAFVMDLVLRTIIAGRGSRLLVIIAVLLFYPVFIGLLKGQDTPFLLLGGMLWLYGLVVKRDRIAGLGLAMTVIRPQIAVILAVPFLLNRQRVWWWFCAWAAGLTFYSLVLVGFEGTRDFIRLMVLSAAGQGYGMAQNAMFNFTGMMLRLFPTISVDLVHDLAWGLFVVATGILSFIWKVSREIRLRHIVLAICVGLFAAPHLHYHDLALLAVALFGLGLIAVKANKFWIPIGTGLALSTSVILLLGEWWDPLRFSVPYLLMFALSLLAWRCKQPDETH